MASEKGPHGVGYSLENIGVEQITLHTDLILGNVTATKVLPKLLLIQKG